MAKLLKDPLVHFLLIGAALFAVSAWRGESIETGRERIVITAAQVAQVRSAAELLEGRPLTDEELRARLEPVIREEVLYREALALGLDENDDEVRRRLVEKMQYLTEDIADPEPASEAELEEFYAASPDLFTIPELVSFEQVFFSPSARGDTVTADAEAALVRLRAGESSEGIGDRTPLRNRYENAPRTQVEVLFGEQIAEALFSGRPGDWQGPYRSDFGLHLVRLESRSPARLPPFAEIRDRVREAFGAQRREQHNQEQYRRMMERYEIVIEPAATEAAPAATP